LEKLFDAGHVFRHVHAHGVVLHFRHADLPAVFHPAQLFQLLDSLPARLAAALDIPQGVALKRVQPQMLQMANNNLASAIRTHGIGAREK